MIERLKQLYSICFEDSQNYTDYVFKHKYSLNNALYYQIDGKIVSQLFFVEKKLYIRDKIIPCPYIVGVCTLPDYRNKGYAGILMQRCFELLTKKGYNLCALHPFKHSFYQKYGFVTYNRVNIYKPSYNGANTCILKDININDMPLVKKLYDNFMGGYSGYAVRDAAQTLKRYKEFASAYCCKLIYSGGNVCGYVYYDNAFAEEYCAPASLLDGIKELDKKPVYIPVTEKKGQTADFTMIKPLSKDRLAQMYNWEGLKRLDDVQFVHALTGSYKEFNTPLPVAVKQKYPPLKNFVFDKY